MCLYPRLTQNKRYTPNIKNGGQVPLVFDKRALATPIICGHCMECRKQKAREWKVRLMEDIKVHQGAQMVTLTFNTQALIHLAEQERTGLDRATGEVWTKQIKDLNGYERDNAICKLAVRQFCNRWRKKYKKEPRHWLISELGHKNTEHVHMHGIIWGNVFEIERIWNNGKIPFGWVFKGNWKNGKIENYVNGKTIGYCVKYVCKMDMQHQCYNPVILASKGIGREFAKTTKEQQFNFEKTKDYYRTETGHKLALPTYWRRKLYTDEQREALWMNKLDQNTRYINGIKIDLNIIPEEQYYKTLNEAQELNKSLGYKDGKKKWKREAYELERRNLIWEYRTRDKGGG